MEPYFFASLPGNPEAADTLKQLKNSIGSIETIYPVKVPILKVGTLDNLLTIGDASEKTDQYVQQVSYRLEKQVYDLQRNETIPKIDRLDFPEAVQKFEWDSSRFDPKTKNLQEILNSISESVTKTDNGMKDRAQEINGLKTQLSTLTRRATGTIAVRPLSELINKEDFIETNKLTTLFVLVPKINIKEWIQNYESFTDYVVPKSSTRIADDDNTVLYSVVLFKNVIDKFKTKCREYRFVIREMSAQSEATENSEEQMKQLSDDLKELYINFAHWCLVSYTDVIMNWLHLKVLRVFVESVLRYGLSFTFQAILIQPQKKSTKKIIEKLVNMYSNLAITPLSQQQPKDGKKKDAKDAASTGAGGPEEVYYSFVYFPLPLLMRMVEK